MNQSILIVEDEDKIARLLEIELEFEGYRVVKEKTELTGWRRITTRKNDANTKLDKEDGRFIYDVKVLTDEGTVEFEIHATSGAIVDMDKDFE